MEVSDLVAIGRLGRQEPDGFHCVKLSPAHRHLFPDLTSCFLIFSSQRVFFVTVVERKITGKRQYLKFKEDGVAAECLRSERIILALAPDELPRNEQELEILGLCGYDVLYQDRIIGTVSDAMINPMQSVFVVDLQDGGELLIPNVEKYVLSVDKKTHTVITQNLDGLLAICTSTS